MPRLFGTDGVRGTANGDVLTPELAMALAASAARVLRGERPGRLTVAVGRDTRPSGPLLEAAAAAGFASEGLDVELLGVVPTPAVAHACATGAADLGLMISASHNPMPDNGLKLFGPGGAKLADAVEDAVEQGLGAACTRPTGTDVGTVATAPAERTQAYVTSLLATLEAPLTGLRVVVDCAQGAASHLAPEVYRRAGADVVAVHADGDGARINDGTGATHLEALQSAVREHGADVGLAHDGDADRCLAVTSDTAGAQVVDGDRILAVCALGMRERGLLPTGTVVATVMSNLGFVLAMREAGIEVVQTKVGDRYVLEAMRAGGHALGGEQSGHVVFGGLSTTGDGLLTGLQLLGRVAATGRSLADLAGVVTVLPQVLVNVRADRSRAEAPDVLEAVAREEASLGETGRVLLRPSGTEPVVRVMVEAPEAAQADEVARRLADVVAGG